MHGRTVAWGARRRDRQIGSIQDRREQNTLNRRAHPITPAPIVRSLRGAKS